RGEETGRGRVPRGCELRRGPLRLLRDGAGGRGRFAPERSHLRHRGTHRGGRPCGDHHIAGLLPQKAGTRSEDVPVTVHRSTDMTEPTHSTTHTAPSSDTHGETSMTAVDTPPTDTSFAARVKSETQDAHDRAEHSHFMGDLLGGKLDRGAYVALLEQYLHLYRALEETERRSAGAPELAGVLDARLDRVASLEADLADLREGAAPAAPTAATAEYVERLTVLPADAPERYFA